MCTNSLLNTVRDSYKDISKLVDHLLECVSAEVCWLAKILVKSLEIL
jgi:hypothetical protein